MEDWRLKFLLLCGHIVSAVIDNDDCIIMMITKGLFSVYSCVLVPQMHQDLKESAKMAIFQMKPQCGTAVSSGNITARTFQYSF